jgi:PilZ domain
MHTQSRSHESPSKTESRDRRGEARRKVDFLINRFLNGYPYLCRATNISRTGIRVVPLHDPAVATQFMGLQFQLPGSEEITTASGEAVFTSGSQAPVGIRFTRMPAASAEQIGRFVAGRCD